MYFPGSSNSFRPDKHMLNQSQSRSQPAGFAHNFYTQACLNSFSYPQQRGPVSRPQFQRSGIPQNPPNRGVISASGQHRMINTSQANQPTMSGSQKRPIDSGLPRGVISASGQHRMINTSQANQPTMSGSQKRPTDSGLPSSTTGPNTSFGFPSRSERGQPNFDLSDSPSLGNRVTPSNSVTATGNNDGQSPVPAQTFQVPRIRERRRGKIRKSKALRKFLRAQRAKLANEQAGVKGTMEASASSSKVQQQPQKQLPPDTIQVAQPQQQQVTVAQPQQQVAVAQPQPIIQQQQQHVVQQRGVQIQTQPGIQQHQQQMGIPQTVIQQQQPPMTVQPQIIQQAPQQQKQPQVTTQLTSNIQPGVQQLPTSIQTGIQQQIPAGIQQIQQQQQQQHAPPTLQTVQPGTIQQQVQGGVPGGVPAPTSFGQPASQLQPVQAGTQLKTMTYTQPAQESLVTDSFGEMRDIKSDVDHLNAMMGLEEQTNEITPVTFVQPNEDDDEDQAFWRAIVQLGLIDEFFREIKTKLDTLKVGMIKNCVNINDAKKASLIVHELGMRNKLDLRLGAHKTEYDKQRLKLEREMEQLKKKYEQKQQILKQKSDCYASLLSKKLVPEDEVGSTSTGSAMVVSNPEFTN